MAELRERGYLVFESFLGADELAAAQEALGLHYPSPEAYFADPGAHAWLATSQWDGLITGPWRSWDLNRLAFHPDLLDLTERFLGSSDLCLYDAELWAKYAGAADYEQSHHRDFGNHTLVVPKRSDPPSQMTAWILLSDVTEEDGPTKVVPRAIGDGVPYWPDTLGGSANDYVANYLPAGAFAEDEVSITGPAGTLVCFRTDVVHRGSGMTGERSARFSLLANYAVWGPRWIGRVGWSARALGAEWGELIERATPRERSVFGFPPPGDPYWDEQTLADTQARYPRADLSPYR
ncbi:MAG TPA: phytanoyl-CoA dioxygenase family protein [Iamia sp.]